MSGTESPPDARDLVETIEAGMRHGREHHQRCATRQTEGCDCYAQTTSRAYDALAELHNRVSALEARIGVLLAYARPVDIQAAEHHIATNGLVGASGEPL